MVSRSMIRKFYLKDESKAYAYYINQFDFNKIDFNSATNVGKKLITEIRHKSKHNIFDAFWQEYSLSSEEGIMLMSLAEAMLRTPDKQNQDALIIDKIDHENWQKHLGQSDSLFVNASSWGLFLTHKFLQLNKEQKKSFKEYLSDFSAKTSQPIIRTAIKKSMEIMGKQFVLGENIDIALKKAQKMTASGWRYSFDMLGEGARSHHDAQYYYQSYLDSMHAIGQLANKDAKVTENYGVSVKISAIYPRFEHSQKQNALPQIIALLTELCLVAKNYNIGLNIDAEEAERLELTLDATEALLKNPDLAGWDGLGVVVQSYQKRCPAVIDWLYEVAKQNNKKIMVRLVKGAYWDSEIKHYQELGEKSYPVWTRKETTDAAYLICAQKLIEYADVFYPQFATHNAATVADVIAMMQGKDIDYEFQCLFGMGEDLHKQIITEYQLPSRIYAPVGTYSHLLSYLIRRLLENSANSSFVHLVGNTDIPIENLLQNPFELVNNFAQIPNEKIVLPPDIYGQGRKNSVGHDLSDDCQLAVIDSNITAPLGLNAHSLTANLTQNEDAQECFAPFDNLLKIGEKAYIQRASIDDVYQAAQNTVVTWAGTNIKKRKEILLKTADMIEENWLDYMNLCIYEAGKTRKDAIAEIREAVDFCRYYALQADKLTAYHQAQGIWVCISPWNFPLAIFIGQIAAALVSGNVVIAKPAEQTSLIAYYTIKKMHTLGVPSGALQLVLGAGDVGAALTELEDLAGVAFTGSTEVAKYIQKALSENSPQAAFIAETGGQNAMIVDSTALPEQVVDDVIASAFQSAGQRCSALRILCVQKDAYANICGLLQGAMKELKFGSPLSLNCDVGPIIDSEAQQNLQKYINEKSSKFLLLYTLKHNEDTQKGSFVAPTLFEITDINQLEKEQFGPILHIYAYERNELDGLIEQIKALGYGLTAGIHSRISYNSEYIAKNLPIGNIYINRNQIGAIVGMQPFGGRGLSGTGPKAGGPHYLKRFAPITNRHQNNTDYLFTASDIRDGNLKRVNTSAWQKSDIAAAIKQWQKKVNILNLPKSQLDIMDNYLHDLATFWVPYFTKNLTLPAITGESNILSLQPRGNIFIDYAQPNFHSLLAIIAVWASTNKLLLNDELPYPWQEFLKTDILPPYEIRRDDASLSEANGVLTCHKNIAQLTKKISWDNKQVIPVYNMANLIYNDNGRISLNMDMIINLTTEKTISTDIARTVGNTELMRL
ncbi:MAG: bifunctional proline dehydrogenase/L-glutamate gamma-semialdehyde dehydrogenase PutA [Alphaproteobacteria bacterium]